MEKIPEFTRVADSERLVWVACNHEKSIHERRETFTPTRAAILRVPTGPDIRCFLRRPAQPSCFPFPDENRL